MSYFKYFPTRKYQFGNTEKTVTDLSKYTAIFADIANDITFYTYYVVKPGERLDSISQKFYGTPDYYWTIPLSNPDIIRVWTNLPVDYRSLNNYIQKKYPGTALIIRNDQTIAGKFHVGERVVTDRADETESVITEIKPSTGYIVVENPTSGTFSQNKELVVTGMTNNNSIIVDSAVPHHLAPAFFRELNSNERVMYDQSPITITIQEEEFQKNELVSQIKIIRPEYINKVVNRFEDEMKLRVKK